MQWCRKLESPSSQLSWMQHGHVHSLTWLTVTLNGMKPLLVTPVLVLKMSAVKTIDRQFVYILLICYSFTLKLFISLQAELSHSAEDMAAPSHQPLRSTVWTRWWQDLNTQNQTNNLHTSCQEEKISGWGSLKQFKTKWIELWWPTAGLQRETLCVVSCLDLQKTNQKSTKGKEWR